MLYVLLSGRRTVVSVLIQMHVVNTLHLQNCQLTLYDMYIELGRKSIVKKKRAVFNFNF